MKQLFKKTSLMLVGVVLTFTSNWLFAGGLSGSGGDPSKYINLLNSQESRIIIVDDPCFIDLIGMMGEKNNEFSDKANINFDGLVLNSGTSFISALRYDDGKNVYMVSESQYEKIKAKTKLDDLVKKLDFDTGLLRLKP